MLVFEEMLDSAVRERFLAYKNNSVSCLNEELEAMRTYLLSEQCTDDIQRLMAGNYFLEPPRQVARCKARSNKKRLIYSFSKENKMLLQLMTFVLHDYDDMFADNLYSFRREKRAIDLIYRLKHTPDLENKYIFKTDINRFGESVDGEILLSQAERLFVRDPQFLAFLRWLLRWRTYRARDGKICHDGPALMSGMPLTSFLENVYLMELDQIFEEKEVLYGRYADDIVLYADTEAQITEYRQIILAEMERRRLTLHAEKTMLLPPGSPVEVLGMKVTGRRVDIADSSLLKMKWKLRRSADRLMQQKKRDGLSDDEAMRLMILAANRRFFGDISDRHELNWCQWAMPVLTETEGLKKLDAAIQNNIRYVGSGKKSNARYRIRFSKLHELGYRSLVNVYYHRFETDWSTLHLR